MPIYEFRCQYCDHLFERLQPMESDFPDCPLCGGEVTRIISAPNHRFKGHGFHVTDYTHHGVRHSGINGHHR